MTIFHETTLQLIEKNDNPGHFLSSICDEVVLDETFKKATDKLGLTYLYLFKLFLFYNFEKYQDAEACIPIGNKYLEGALSTYFIPTFYFYSCLTLMALYETKTTFEKLKIRLTLAINFQRFKKWAKICPDNFKHKLLIMKAEYASTIQKNYPAAQALYDEAIDTARKYEFLNEEALANELAAKFYLSQGNEKIARIYMQDARHCYLLWGADAKVAVLDEKYPLLTGKDTLSNVMPTHVSTSASDRAGSQVLDMATIQKSSQAISGTIVLADLLKRLMNIVIENAGAQKSYLLLPKKGRYVIEAEGNVNQSEAEVLKSIEVKPDVLPNSIINYVIHSKDSIVLDNASENERFMNDEYIIEHSPKSVLCMPLLNQGKLSGILYMENNLTEGAFTKDRINTLNLLSSQIAISIDNARLYSNTIQLNEQLIVLNKAYERFVPEDFLSLLEKKSITDVELGDQVQEKMSVLFTDIRNFTTLSESMSPEDNFRFINSFLSVMAPVIKKYNGFVDKYIGDAIMALYPRDTDDAVQCALEMQSALKEYNQARTDTNRMPISIGIGINTGLLMLGTVGEKHRMNATVISDAVNIASRIESLTKTYQAPILISEDTYKSLKNPARFKITVVDDKVLVKGKTKPIAVYKVEEA